MTREQRLELLKQIEKDIHVCSLESTLLDDAKSCAIHSTIEELEQEPFKPMVEIDLYSVIKQKYIEREVIDKIRAEIERQEKWLMDAGYNQYNVDIALDTLKSVVDKCKAESEEEDG